MDYVKDQHRHAARNMAPQKMIGIINYGMGNLASVKNALTFLNIPNEIFDNPAQINNYNKLVLPGVGAFAMAMDNLKKSGFDEAIKNAVIGNQKPLLGLCLGMQLLFDTSSEHGVSKGLGLIEGKVDNLAGKINLSVPHVGWNSISVKSSTSILKNISAEEQTYYFVHSFYCEAADRTVVTATVNYGFDFDVVVEKGIVFGCQFHPEKSQKSGLQILKNFSAL